LGKASRLRKSFFATLESGMIAAHREDLLQQSSINSIFDSALGGVGLPSVRYRPLDVELGMEALPLQLITVGSLPN